MRASTSGAGAASARSSSPTPAALVDGEEHPVKLGVFITNSKTRRAKLTTAKLTALAALGLEWA
ncbi:hypothetical protein OG596_37695 [Streptomyces sp. NBC_01102]|uniref:hypothetical protein n=1 Tax=unclassified Streptomyces TaxID=2593676 RepID=UPI003870083F|nr:hypothetical protein OG596_00225 [Streptomyces sp. NBC_01102]WSU70693.1 hypothetical protein OG596_37695 [Streptomyces sp. NBC_01102]